MQHWLLATVLGLACASPLALAAPHIFEDSMAQRTLACTACHGPLGRAASDGYYPRIAGKPAGYLYNQLLNFRDGRRHYGLMTELTAPLSDAYLLEIARYFSALDLPYPPPQPAQAAPAVLRRGEQLVRQGEPARGLPACVQCHGEAMTGVLPAVPGLLGLPRDYIQAQLGAWRAGQRQAHAPDCMRQVAQQLSGDEVTAVASWLAAQPLPTNTHPARQAPVRTMAVKTPACGTAPAEGAR